MIRARGDAPYEYHAHHRLGRCGVHINELGVALSRDDCNTYLIRWIIVNNSNRCHRVYLAHSEGVQPDGLTYTPTRIDIVIVQVLQTKQDSASTYTGYTRTGP